MSLPIVHGQVYALKIAASNQTPRYVRMDMFERYVEGTQYEGRVHFLDQSSDVPLRERAPCIVYPIVKAAIESHADMVVGETHFPVITSHCSEDDREFDPEYGLSEDDSYVLDKCIEKIIEQTKLRTLSYSLLCKAQQVGSVAALLGVRQGKLFIELVRAQWCTPSFHPITREVLSLEIRYPFIVNEWDDVQKIYRSKCKIYRRIIDAAHDVTYVPADAREDGSEPRWTVDPNAVFDHNLGFCPVQWYPFLKECSTVSEIDGTPIHAHLFDEIDALNFVLSQGYRAAIYAGDPLLVKTGVDPFESNSNPGRFARSIILPGDPDSPNSNLQSGRFGFESYGLPVAQKKGVGEVWTLENPDAKVQLITLPGDALKALDDQAVSLRSKICESLSVLWIDPETAKLATDLSGKALDLLYKKQTAHCDQIRSDFGDKCLLPIVHMLLRIAYVTHSQSPGSLYLAGIDKAYALLQRFEKQAVNIHDEVITQWIPPHIDLVWPPYFTPTDADGLQVSQMIQNVLQLKLITKEMALQKLKPFFPFSSADDVLEAIEEEQEEQAPLSESQEQETMKSNANDSLQKEEPPASSPAKSNPFQEADSSL